MTKTLKTAPELERYVLNELRNCSACNSDQRRHGDRDGAAGFQLGGLAHQCRRRHRSRRLRADSARTLSRGCASATTSSSRSSRKSFSHIAKAYHPATAPHRRDRRYDGPLARCPCAAQMATSTTRCGIHDQPIVVVAQCQSGICGADLQRLSHALAAAGRRDCRHRRGRFRKARRSLPSQSSAGFSSFWSRRDSTCCSRTRQRR